MGLHAGSRLTRHSEAGELLEAFLVAAVVSVLAIRWLLALTGYPQIGDSGLHVAHMLWGGLFMVVALVLGFLFLDRSVQRAAAVIAGIGFGTFIDEIGKFVTTDNDYFYRPAIALIYVIFVVLFLVLRAVLAEPRLTPRESLANALDLLEGGLDGAIDPATSRRVRVLLGRADPDDPLTGPVGAYFAALPQRPDARSWRAHLAERAAVTYERLVANPAFERTLVVAVVVYAVGAVGAVAFGLIATGGTVTGHAWTISRMGEVLSSLVGAALVLLGIGALPRSRVAAYHWFLRGLLVWILVTQVFVFYASQLAGIGGLALDLLAYAALRSMLGREQAAS